MHKRAWRTPSSAQYSRAVFKRTLFDAEQHFTHTLSRRVSRGEEKRREEKRREEKRREASSTAVHEQSEEEREQLLRLATFRVLRVRAHAVAHLILRQERECAQEAPRVRVAHAQPVLVELERTGPLCAQPDHLAGAVGRLAELIACASAGEAVDSNAISTSTNQLTPFQLTNR